MFATWRCQWICRKWEVVWKMFSKIVFSKRSWSLECPHTAFYIFKYILIIIKQNKVAKQNKTKQCTVISSPRRTEKWEKKERRRQRLMPFLRPNSYHTKRVGSKFEPQKTLFSIFQISLSFQSHSAINTACLCVWFLGLSFVFLFVCV